MNKLLAILIFPATFSLLACAQLQPPSGGPSAEAVAFPGAEGFGKYATGGRGGKVFVVTTLADSGPGSLREAVERKEPKMVVFAVSGTIHLASPLSIKGNTTVAGQTAPGDGICIADYPVSLNGNNIIVRYLRFRMGDRYQNGGKVPGSGHDDAFSAQRRTNIIIDHCSLSWGTDEVFSVYAGDSTTLQWNLISEPLNYSYHFEKGDTDFERHGYGGIWGGQHLSAHHNLFAHCVSRTPRFNGIRHTPTELVDFQNNVIYNWGSNNVYGGEGGTYNIVGNYYKYGPGTNKNVQFRIVNPGKQKAPAIPFGKYYVADNYVDGSAEVTANNVLGVHLSDGTEEDKKGVVQRSPFATVALSRQKAADAYESVLQGVGANWPARDTLDQRIIQEVKSRTGRVIDVQGGFPHGTPYEQTMGAWPNLKAAAPKPDTDSDGMPDAWEVEKGLNPGDPSDASGNGLHRHYTNIELYINNLLSKS